jgi:hypothetical protein
MSCQASHQKFIARVAPQSGLSERALDSLFQAARNQYDSKQPPPRADHIRADAATSRLFLAMLAMKLPPPAHPSAQAIATYNAGGPVPLPKVPTRFGYLALHNTLRERKALPPMPTTRPAWLMRRAGQGEKFRGNIIAPKNHTLNFSPRDGLTAEEREVESRFARILAADVDGALTRYREIAAQAQKPNVLDVDFARRLCPEYAANPTRWTQATHEPASALVKELYRRMLEEEDPHGLDLVVFTAGGTGAGKSSASDVVDLPPRLKRLIESAQCVLDGSMADYGSTAKKVGMALDAGKNVAYVYVARDPCEAMLNGVVPRAIRTGRVVTVAFHVRSHVASAATALALADENRLFAFSLMAVDNTRGDGKAALGSSTLLVSLAAQDEATLQREIVEALAARHDHIPPAIYEGLVRSLGSDVQGGAGGKGESVLTVDAAKLKSLESASPGEEVIMRRAMPFSEHTALIALSMAQSINLGAGAKEH